MAQIKICRSTGRIALVDNLPPVYSDYLFNIDVENVRYYGSALRFERRITSIASCFAGSPEEVEQIIKCFGLDWEPVETYGDALEILGLEYEELCERCLTEGF